MLRCFLAIALLLPAAPVFGQGSDAALKTELEKIDSRAANPDAKPVVAAAMADDLKVHRNHLVLLRAETGESYSRIYVSALEKEGLDQNAILARARALNREIERRLGESVESNGGVKPSATVATGVDHNAAGTFYWLQPEVGIASPRGSLVVGVPYYRTSATDFSASGVGDAYIAGSLYGHAGGADFGGALTVGLPTGDENLGLGAGKVTADVTGTVARSFARVRPYLSAGFANSIANFAYARPYIADGNAAHFAGGVGIEAARRLSFGVSGFSVRPFGTQNVYSRVVMPQATVTTGTGSTPPPPSGSGMGGSGTGGRGNGPGAGQGAAQHMPFLASPQSVVASSELEDYGANAWASIAVARGVEIDFGVARSVPFHLTTASVGLRFDVVRVLRAH